MTELLTPFVAVVLMYTGVLPSLANVYLLYDHRQQPGVVWFLLLMGTAGAWALLYATFTLVPSPAITLALANFFWVTIPTAAVAMFLLAYEFVFRTVASRRLVAALFLPVLVLFVLSWPNPANLVFTPAYSVGPGGFLYFPPLGGPVKILVTKVYGYLLVSFAAGMFVGEALRSRGLRRRQSIYLLFIFTAVVLTTVVKVAGVVPIYFDPSSVAFSLSGLVFAYSIDKHGWLKFASVAREQAFQAVDEVILVVDPNGIVTEVNSSGAALFDGSVVGEPLSEILPAPSVEEIDGAIQTIELEDATGPRFFAWRSSTVEYGRGLTGQLVVLSDISALKRRQNELDLLKQILTRIFRHNMRNDLNVIEGFTSLIEEEGDERIAELAEKIRLRATRLGEQAEKARAIEKVFSHQEPEHCSLREAVDRAVAPYEGRSDVEIQRNVEDVVVEVHPQFDTALAELLDNAVTHHDTGTGIEVDIRSRVEADGVVLVVEDNGPGIHDQEIRVLEARQETSLQHSSGIGLWLVNLIVTRLGGYLEIESTGTGTRVEIHLRRADQGDAGP